MCCRLRAMCALFPRIYILLYMSFELLSMSSFSVAWEVEQLADMCIAVSKSALYPHVFAHKHISLTPLFGFCCANSRSTKAPNGPTPLTPPHNSSEKNIGVYRDTNPRLPQKNRKENKYIYPQLYENSTYILVISPSPHHQNKKGGWAGEITNCLVQ